MTLPKSLAFASNVFSTDPPLRVLLSLVRWFQSMVTHMLKEQNHINISKSDNKKEIPFYFVRDLTQLNKYNSSNANR